MNGKDETWVGQRGEIPPNPPKRQQADSIFFSDAAINDVESRRRRAGQGSRPDDRRYDEPVYNDGYDDRPPNSRGGPQVLASTASEWDESRQDDLVLERQGPNRFLVFALAALCAALLGVGFAVFSIFRGDGEVATTEDTISALEGANAGTETSTPDDAPLTQDPATTTTLDPALVLDFQLFSNTFVCDDTVREFGQITGADPNEQIDFTSPQSTGISPGQADATGALPVRWKCSIDQIGTIWELTGTGAVSGKVGTATFSGVDTSGASTLGPLAIDVFESPFQCNGEVRPFAALSGALANNQIDFTSPQATGLRPGTTDEQGKLNVRWSCNSEQVGTVWELTATEPSTGRSVDFTFTGS